MPTNLFGDGKEAEDKVNALMENRQKWYGDAQEYWSKISPDLEGMLQGFEKITDVDCKESIEFIKKLQSVGILGKDLNRALDCGGGVGRVSKGFLLKCFKTVDIMDQEPKFTDKIPEFLEEDASRCEHIFTEGMQNFQPQDNRYDVIWIQWVIGHLTDEDCVKFLQRCVSGLTRGGLICIKDNVSGVDPVFDPEDSSVTRNKEKYEHIFKQADLQLLTTKKQTGFPSNMFRVNMYALSPYSGLIDIK